MTTIVLALATLVTSWSVTAQDTFLGPEGTFSIVARDPNTGELGMAVQSKAFATGSRTITIKGGVAVVAHQSQSNPMYGTLGLELLSAGRRAIELNPANKRRVPENRQFEALFADPEFKKIIGS